MWQMKIVLPSINLISTMVTSNSRFSRNAQSTLDHRVGSIRIPTKNQINRNNLSKIHLSHHQLFICQKRCSDLVSIKSQLLYFNGHPDTFAICVIQYVDCICLCIIYIYIHLRFPNIERHTCRLRTPKLVQC